ncbi:TonB-dependent copper receptor [Lysobacter pythonis]|uniref:TonB-dependent copper receptor n=1 Tax=Solilutibacter pythonis TaxID=2483112 RepID=A0A3M2HMH9_9GAMM|nr:TonB-dependent copper receptor [Lysobacter pythonis]RMH90921.1 TonB-dependent copper receptor [Lysobacter pythonis]
MSFSSFRPTARRARLALAVACVLAAPAYSRESPPAAGQDDDETPVFTTVIVIGQSPVFSPETTSDPKQSRSPMPASDAADYLKVVPGFSAIRNGGSNSDPVLRGMSGSRLNIVDDGGALHGACPYRMDNPLSYVSPDAYDRLTVLKGPQSVQWGPGASAGTVRFERDRERYDTLTTRFDANAMAGSAGRRDLAIDGLIGQREGYVRLAGNRTESDDYRDGGGQIVPSAWKKWNTDVSLGWTPGEHTLLEISAGRGDGQARYGGRGMDGSQFLRQRQGLRFVQESLPGVLERLRIDLYRNDVNHVMDNYTLRTPNPNSMMSMPMAAQVRRDTRGGRLALDWAATQWKGTVGLDFQRSRHTQRMGMGRGTYLQRPWEHDADLGNTGLFTEITWLPDDDAQWVAGVRHDRARVRDLRLKAWNPTAGQRRDAGLNSGFLRYEYGRRGALQAFVGLGHNERMPDYWELFSAKNGPVGSPNAFAGTRPEKTTQLDAGLQWRSQPLDVWASAYLGRVSDYLLFDYDRGSRVRNIDARIHGIEAGAEWRPAAGWALGGTLAQAWGANRSDRTWLPQMAPRQLRLHAGWSGERFSTNVQWRGVAAQRRVALGQGNVVGRDLGPSAGFGTVALSAGWKFDHGVELTGGIDNLFDRRYSEHLNLAGSADFGFPADPVRINEPGRSLWLRLSFKH